MKRISTIIKSESNIFIIY